MNNYFNDFQEEECRKKSRSLPGWVWLASVIGLVISIIWGYSIGSNSAKMMNLGTIPDETPDSFDLGTLDFTDPLYIFSSDERFFGYNLIDYPSTATYYDSSRAYNENGGYENTFNSAAKFSVDFINLNGYDVPCVFDSSVNGETPVTVNMSFESNVASGNLEARLVALSKDYQTEQTEDGYYKIKPEYIETVYSFKANEKITKSVEYSGDTYLVLVVAGESAMGSYSFAIAVQSEG